MTINYTEKRNFIRMPINHTLTFKLTNNADLNHGICKNLSADGISFLSDKMLDTGTHLDINITPEKSFGLPLDASVEIVRVTANSRDNNYEIAGIIKKIN